MAAPVGAVDEGLRPWATPRQAEYLDAVNKTGSFRAAAKLVGVDYRSVLDSMTALRAKAAKAGYAPAQDARGLAPDGYSVKGKSILYDADGKIRQQWVKTQQDAEAQERLAKEAVRVLCDGVQGLAPITAPPSKVLDDLLVVYPMGDPHIGMYAWGKETGEDFDLEIARRLTFGAADRLLSSAPPAGTAIILPLGDVFHSDDQTNRTPAHQHQLDVDSRFVKILQVGVELFRHVVLRALEQHDKVIVRFVQGNHDPHSIWSLAFTISAYFSSEPRVTVDLSPSRFWYYRFGKVLIGATHGDTVKHDALLGVMASDRPQDWGETTARYWYTGHIHKTTVTELNGVVCESFRTLAAKDAFASSYGYRPGRDMVAIVHHKTYGEIERHRCDVAMLDR